MPEDKSLMEKAYDYIFPSRKVLRKAADQGGIESKPGATPVEPQSTDYLKEQIKKSKPPVTTLPSSDPGKKALSRPK